MKYSTDKTRLDKWLWAARFFKTRNLASQAIQSGKVLVNARKPKPSTMIKKHDNVRIRKNKTSLTIKILELSKQRKSAKITESLYELIHQNITPQSRVIQNMSSPIKGRPTKKNRRALDSLTKRY